MDEVGENMSVQVVHFDEGDAECRGHALGKAHAHEQTTHQARAEGDGDGGEFLLVHARLLQGSIYHRDNVLLVGAAGQFGHHAAILFVHCLRSCDVAEEDPVAHHGRRSVVAARFDGEKDGVFLFCHVDRCVEWVSE